MSYRLAQVRSVVHEALARQINEFLTGDEGVVTVNFVEVQPDLRAAVIWVAFEKPENGHRVIQALTENRQKFQKYLAKNYDFKYTPVLEFKIDKGQASAEQVDELLDKI